MREGNTLSLSRLKELLQRIEEVRVGVLGDLCLDVYWHIDMRRSELSRETPHYNLPVDWERYSPGAGGNVVKNVAALRPAALFAAGLIGQDWRGEVLSQCLEKSGADLRFLIREPDRVTCAYCKPVCRGLSPVEQENPRIDFAPFSPPSRETEEKLVSAFEKMAKQADIICLSDQFSFGSVTPLVREAVVDYAKRGGLVVADSRNRISSFPYCILKPNEFEATQSVGIAYQEGKTELVEQAAQMLAAKNHSPVCATLGEKGCLIVEEDREPLHLPSCPTLPPIDFCGAGDTFLSAFSCALAAGASMEEAAGLATLGSGVTIRKIQETGDASPEEIVSRFEEMFRCQ